MKRILCGIAATLLLPGAMPASAQPERKSASFDAVTRCRAVADPAARLNCYDRAVELLQSAEQRHEIAIVDRGQVRETKKSLFGLALPRLPIFGGADDGQEISQIESTLASAVIDGGAWRVQLADGSNWRQMDDNELGRRPRPGDRVTVKRAALNSFRMTIAGAPGIKVQRVN